MSAILMTPLGEIILPAQIRERYGFNDWQVMRVIDMGNGTILLKSYESELTKSTKQLRETLEEEGITLDDLLQTLDEARAELFKERYGNMDSRDS